MVTFTHSMPLMMVAVVVAIVAAFTGLALTNNIASRPELARKTLVTMSSLVIGGGIWTMHFLAMLANHYSVPVGYDVVFTLSSGLTSTLMVGVALLVLHYSRRTIRVLNGAGVILAAGILIMHYVGMSAMRGVTPSYSLVSILLTAVIGLIACVCAVRVAYGKRSRDHIMFGGLLLGLSVVLIHYTAMFGTRYEVTDHSGAGTIAIANSVLAIVLVVAVFVICGAFLLVSATFLTRPQPSLAATPETVTSNAHEESATSGNKMRSEIEGGHKDASNDAVLDVRPPDQSAEQLAAGLADSEPDSAAISDGPPATEPRSTFEQAPVGGIRVPYERNKKLSYVTSDDIGAIRADGRYTQLYTESGVFFCPWSITEAEKNLAGTAFYRSHRSYLINVPKMSAYEKRKDSGVCLFENFEQLTKVPVSRTRAAGLLDILGHG